MRSDSEKGKRGRTGQKTDMQEELDWGLKEEEK